MDKKLLVLLVEDDQNACKELIDYAGEIDDLDIIGFTNNSTTALEFVEEYMPDAVILDLELNNGGGNGLDFLRQLNNLNIRFKPYILITTNNTSIITYEYTRTLGSDFIMSKHQSDYSAKNVIEFLRMMKDILLQKTQSIDMNHQTTENTFQKNKRITKHICKELDLIGISPKAVGYQYLQYGIQTILEKPINNLCAVIGQKYKKSDASVERAMQNAINKAWRTNDIDELSKHYTARISSEKGVPTLTEFVFYYANKLKNEY